MVGKHRAAEASIPADWSPPIGTIAQRHRGFHAECSAVVPDGVRFRSIVLSLHLYTVTGAPVKAGSSLQIVLTGHFSPSAAG